MILRSWHGIVPVEKAAEFREYIYSTGVAEVKEIKGNLGAYIYSVTQGEFEHFFMVSYWENFDAIRKFAGPHPQIAVTYPEDYKYDLISDPIVLHHPIKEVPTKFPVCEETK